VPLMSAKGLSVALVPARRRRADGAGGTAKASDPRSKNWTGGESVELDAIEPDTLRGLVRDSIERHVDRQKLDVLLVAEQSEREQLAMFAHEAR
jgi:hypothetical protein